MTANGRQVREVALGRALARAAALLEVLRDANFLREAGVIPSAAQIRAWADEIDEAAS
jgi:hypothetical protein